MRLATGLFALLVLTAPADAQRLFVGLEGTGLPTRSSDLAGFPNVSWSDHNACDVSGAAATPEGELLICAGPFTTRLYRLALSGSPELLATISVDIHGMGYGNGTLYGFSNFTSPRGIYTIDRTTGQAALAVDLDASGFRFFALDFNPDDGLLYGYTEYGSPTGLYSIDPVSGATTFITGPIPASNTQGRALAVGHGTIYLAATRGADEIPLYAYDLEAGAQWVAFTAPYPQSNATGGAAWIPAPASGLPAGKDAYGLSPTIDLVAPNPVRNGARVAWSLPAPGRYRLELFDVAGRCVSVLDAGMIDSGSWTTTWNRTVEGAGLPAGTYYLRLWTEGGDATAPIRLIR